MNRMFIIIGVIVTILSGCIFFPNPPKPEITHGEFPFRLTYEIDKQFFEVEDTLICDYDGFGANEARGKYRQWKSRLASGNTRITLFIGDEIEIFFSPNISNLAAGAFYMGDTEMYSSITYPFPDAWYSKNFNPQKPQAYIISADEMLEKYKIRLISWEISEPIQNTFK